MNSSVRQISYIAPACISLGIRAYQSWPKSKNLVFCLTLKANKKIGTRSKSPKLFLVNKDIYMHNISKN